MKNLLTVALAVVLTGSAFAYNPNDPAPGSRLVPTKVVNPSSLPRTFTRELVTIEFSVDAHGRPQNILIVSKTDRAVREQVVKAFKQWEFDPRAVATTSKRFLLPIEVVVPGV